MRRLTIIVVGLCTVLVSASTSTHASPTVGTPSAITYSRNVAEEGEDRDFDLFTADLDGSNERGVIQRNSYDDFPTWSPDGRRLAFTTNGHAHLVAPSGGRERRLQEIFSEGGETWFAFPTDWSPDAQSILYLLPQAGGQDDDGIPNTPATGEESEIAVAVGPADGSKPPRQIVPPAHNLGGSWSPDGRWIVFYRQRFEGQARLQEDIFIVRPNGTGLRQLNDDDPYTNYRTPYWLPDGRITFLSNRDCLGPAGVGPCRALYVMDRDGSNIEALTPAGKDFTGDGEADNLVKAIPSPNGSKFAVWITTAEDVRELWIWDRKTDTARKVTQDILESFTWRPGCDVQGTPGRDVLVGTRGSDLICGSRGNDVIRGRGGRDAIFGHGGRDRLVGGRGRDIVVGGPGRDRCATTRRDISVVC